VGQPVGGEAFGGEGPEEHGAIGLKSVHGEVEQPGGKGWREENS
jgi:hypothetical protein